MNNIRKTHPIRKTGNAGRRNHIRRANHIKRANHVKRMNHAKKGSHANRGSNVTGIRETYLSRYCIQNHKRERKTGIIKRISIAAVIVCLLSSIAFAVCKIPMAEVFAAAGGKDGSSGSGRLRNVISGNAESGKGSIENAASGNTESGNVTSETAVSGNGIFGNAMSGNIVSGNAVSENITFENAMSGNTTEIVSEITAVNAASAQNTVEKLLKTEQQEETPVIIIDAGHGGEDEGCSKEGILEKTINLEIAKLVQTKLEELGYEVIMVRENDTYIAKEDRVKMANASKAALYVSIHQNFSDDAGVNGMEVWYDGTDKKRDNKRLAQLVKQQTQRSTEAVERELRGDADFHVTGNTTMAACLIETGFLSNQEERKNLAAPEYQEKIAKGIAQGIEYYFHPKTMYLTFDDGPYGENTERVLDVLKEKGIHATFFLVGENVRKHPEIAQRIVAEGHTIGVHSDTHDYETIYASVDAFTADFEAARQTIYEVTGVDTKLFRFPGGSVNAYNKKTKDAIIKEMTKRGYIYYDWNASLGDAARKGTEPENLIANGVGSTLGRKKVVMLAHDVIYNTSICLEDLLDCFPEYEMKPLDESIEPVQF